MSPGGSIRRSLPPRRSLALPVAAKVRERIGWHVERHLTWPPTPYLIGRHEARLALCVSGQPAQKPRPLDSPVTYSERMRGARETAAAEHQSRDLESSVTGASNADVAHGAAVRAGCVHDAAS